jgi:hypothetical protein
MAACREVVIGQQDEANSYHRIVASLMSLEEASSCMFDRLQSRIESAAGAHAWQFSVLPQHSPKQAPSWNAHVIHKFLARLSQAMCCSLACCANAQAIFMHQSAICQHMRFLDGASGLYNKPYTQFCDEPYTQFCDA